MTETALDAQLRALRDGVAFASPDTRSLVRATGPDTLSWLERLCSNPVAQIGAGEVVRATFMDGKGKLRADLRVLADGAPADGLLLDIPRAERETTLRLLDMFIIQDDVNLEDVSQSYHHLALLGPGARDLLGQLGFDAPAAGRLSEPREGVLVLEEDLLGSGGVELFVDRELSRDLVAAVLGAGAARASEEALELIRLENGVPRFDKDLRGGVIPLEALLDERVSTTKGCYPGQEVVARIRNLGQVARKLVRLQAAGEHELGEQLELTTAEGKAAGAISSWAAHPGGGRTLALGYVRRASWKSGTVLRAGEVEFVVHALDEA